MALTKGDLNTILYLMDFAQGEILSQVRDFDDETIARMPAAFANIMNVKKNVVKALQELE